MEHPWNALAPTFCVEGENSIFNLLQGILFVYIAFRTLRSYVCIQGWTFMGA